MLSIKALTILLVFLGTGFMFISITESLRANKSVPPVLRGKWYVITGLMFFFLAGYVSFLVIQIKDFNFPLELVTSIVFLGGSVFVFLVINLSRFTINNINESKNQLREINDILRIKNEELEDENIERQRAEEALIKYKDGLEALVAKRTQDLEVLLDFTKNLTSTTEQKSLYRIIVSLAKDMLGLDFSTLLTLAEDKQSLILMDTIGFPPETIKSFSPGENGLCSIVAREGKPLMVPDLSSDSRFELPDLIRRNNISSAVCVPMVLKNEVLGVLIGHTHEKREFDEGEINLYRNLADQAAVAIANSRQIISVQRSEQKFRTLFDNASDAIYIQDFDGNILEVNQMGCERLGYSREELLAMNRDRIVAPGSMPTVIEHSEEVAAGRRAVFEVSHLKKDGTQFPVEQSCRAIEYNEKPAILSIVRDISLRKKMEENLRQAQKMEAIGTLSGGIAHEFNNILTAILGFTDLAKECIPEDAPARRDLEQVLTSGRRARDLVSQMLAFSRRQEEGKRKMQIHFIVKEALKLLRASIPSTIEISQNIDPECGAIMADSVQIHQLLMNLYSNAAQAMEKKGGELTVELAEEAIEPDDTRYSAVPPGHYIRITVTDNGHGMDQATIDRMFEPFFTTREVGRGSGMGLAVVHGIIQNHEGHICIESEPGKGTSVHVFFPNVSKETAALIQTGLNEPEANNERILLVDDEKILVDMEEEILERLGYRVFATTSSLKALEAFKAAPETFDLVLTDQVMPKMTGSELTREILKIRSDMPIILVTGYSEIVTEEKAKAFGIRHMVPKPFTKDKIAYIIRNALDGVRS